MSVNNIKRLLDAFYKGETSVEEEEQMFLYFNEGDVCEDLLADKDLFLNIYKRVNVAISDSYSEKIDALFDELEQKEKKQLQYRHILIWAGSIVAMLALLFVFTKYHTPIHPNDNRLAIIDTSFINVVHTHQHIDTLLHLASPQLGEKEIKAANKKAKKRRAKAVSVEAKKKDDYEIMKEALEMVSQNINKGLGDINIISESLLQATEELNNKRILIPKNK